MVKVFANRYLSQRIETIRKEVKAKPTKKHRNSIVLNKLASTATRELQRVLREIIESMKILEPHITKARYPILRGLELLPPNKFYTKETAHKVLAQAKKVVTHAKAYAI